MRGCEEWSSEKAPEIKSLCIPEPVVGSLRFQSWLCVASPAILRGWVLGSYQAALRWSLLPPLCSGVTPTGALGTPVLPSSDQAQQMPYCRVSLRVRASFQERHHEVIALRGCYQMSQATQQPPSRVAPRNAWGACGSRH